MLANVSLKKTDICLKLYLKKKKNFKLQEIIQTKYYRHLSQMWAQKRLQYCVFCKKVWFKWENYTKTCFVFFD
jgi:hypothetical protein